MFVERRDCFDAGRTVMDLVQRTPQKVARMTSAMPPVENEGTDEPGEEAFDRSGNTASDVKYGPTTEPLIPRVTRKHDDTELRRIQKRGAGEPGR
jgi:hypothetical protein